MPEIQKIAYVLKRFPRFSETFILNELLAHEAAGAEVHVFSLLAPPHEPRHARLADLKAEVTVLKSVGKGRAGTPMMGDAALFSGKTPQDIGALQAKAEVVAERCKGLGISHLHAHFGSDSTTVACLAARRLAGTFSYTAHARDIYHTYVSATADDAMRRAKMREAAFTVTVSEYNAQHLAQICPTARIVRLYNGIDLGAFQPVARTTDPLPQSFIAVGRLVEKKGHDVLIKACAALKARGLPFEVSIIGSGPLEGALQSMIRDMGLSDSVKLLGPMPQERLISFMARARAAVLPCVVTPSGDRDGLPTVLLEAMARGLPVITTTVSGGPEIVEQEKTGLLCAPDDVAGLADAMAQMLSDDEMVRRMGRAGRLRAERLFDLTTNAARLRALLRDPERAGQEAA